MTEDMKKFLALAAEGAGVQKELIAAVQLEESTRKSSVTEIAAKGGITLTDSDFADDAAELDDSELADVAGGAIGSIGIFAPIEWLVEAICHGKTPAEVEAARAKKRAEAKQERVYTL